MPDIDRGTLDALLRAAEARLRAKVPGLNEGNCSVTDYFMPPQLLHETAVTVCAGDGEFDDALFEGGGHQTLGEQTTLMVTVFRRYLLDSNDRARTALLDTRTGMLVHYKPLILKTLLLDDDGNPWDPLYKGDRFLRDSLSPLRATAPKPVSSEGSGREYLWMQIAFRAYFDWSF